MAGLLSLSGFAGCSTDPPRYLSDQAEALVFQQVLTRARAELGLLDTVRLHPFLSVVQDSAGIALVRLDEFEYEPSQPVAILAARDSMIVLCEPNTLGGCPEGPYVVLSQIQRYGDRDAVAYALHIDPGPGGGVRRKLFRLRFSRGRWKVAY